MVPAHGTCPGTAQLLLLAQHEGLSASWGGATVHVQCQRGQIHSPLTLENPISQEEQPRGASMSLAGGERGDMEHSRAKRHVRRWDRHSSRSWPLPQWWEVVGDQTAHSILCFFFPTGTLTSMTTLRFMVGSSGLLPVHEQAAAVVQVLNPSAGSSRHGPRAPSPGLVPRHWYRGLPSHPLLFPCFPSHRSWDLSSRVDFFLPWDIPFFLTGPHRSPRSSTPSYMDFSTPFPFSACSLPLQVAPWTPLRCP